MTYQKLFKSLDDFLEKEQIRKKTKWKCCNDTKIILSPNLLLNVCMNCGVVEENFPNEIYDNPSEYGNPYEVKTIIPYQKKLSHLTRISTWINYDYKEIRYNNSIEFFNNKINSFYSDIKITANELYNTYYTLKIRGKTRNALMCYCLYRSFLIYEKPINIKDLFKLFNISKENYQTINIKLPVNKRLYYPNLYDDYVSENNSIKQNELIIEFNVILLLMKQNTIKKQNIRSVILYLIYKHTNHKIYNFVDKYPITKKKLLILERTFKKIDIRNEINNILYNNEKPIDKGY